MRIAVTGNIGSGKSTLARLLAELGAEGVDADRLARQVVDDNHTLRRQLAEAFGGDLLDDQGQLDRRGLARRALADEAGRRRLEDLVRPHLEPRLRQALEQAEATSGVAVLDAPLVFEWGIEDWFDRIIVVQTDADTAARRVAASRDISPEEVHQRRRAQHQAPAGPGIITVDNNGDLSDLRQAADRLWSRLVDPEDRRR